MKQIHTTRHIVSMLTILFIAVTSLILHPDIVKTVSLHLPTNGALSPGVGTALEAVNALDVKGRAPKTAYSRQQFGNGWKTTHGCDMRNVILKRDMTETVVDNGCKVAKGVLSDPYTGRVIQFVRGETTSDDVQIDHVVALGDAWQTGAQQLDAKTREAMANDPLELLAVDGPTNQQKSDSDAASWLPSNKSFRCAYVARQVAVKKKYKLWVTPSEKEAIENVLTMCQTQVLPIQ